MSQRNENRLGYKKTNIGWIPNEWSIGQFSDLAIVIMGQSPDGISYNNVQMGIALINGPTEFQERFPKKIQWTRKPTKLCKRGDILLCVRGSSTGRINIANDEYCIGRGIAAIRAKASFSDELYLEFILKFLTGRILRLTVGSTFPNIDKQTLLKMKMGIPPLPEQKKIAEILSAWDRAIEQTRNLIEAKKQLKKGLMQKLLTGQIRFPQFGPPAKNGELPEGWIRTKIGDLLKQVSRPIEFDDEKFYKLISVRRRSEGLFHRVTLQGKKIVTKDLYLAKDGDFLISKMQVVHGAMGLVTEAFDNMYISGSYISLIPKDESKLDIAYFDYLSKMPEMYHTTFVSSYGVHIEKMTFNLKLFMKSEVKLPARLSEQRIIVNNLNDLNRVILLHEQNLSKLQLQKKGLMQKLLTGEVRTIKN